MQRPKIFLSLSCEICGAKIRMLRETAIKPENWPTHCGLLMLEEAE